MSKTLTPTQAKAFYDRFGKWQDSQRFYEDKATNQLLAQSNFGQTKKVFEFGCGTGRFAQKLLGTHLPTDAIYLGVDISSTMVQLANARLTEWAERATPQIGDATTLPNLPSGSYDCFVSNYVLDLLDEGEIRAVLGQAHRLLTPDGKLCLTSLGFSTTGLARLITAGWLRLHRLRPQLVGGCRPINLSAYLPASHWSIQSHEVVRAFGITSEVVIALPLF